MAGSDLAPRVLDTCRTKGLMIATAESCTGGMVASSLVDIPGSSDVVDCGFVTYSNEAKARMLGVPMDLITQHGAVSDLVARAMAEGALANSRADLAVAITGVAGPGGGTVEKPEGLVHFAAAQKGGNMTAERIEYGALGRSEVRRRSMEQALRMLFELAEGSTS
ncbi:MAG: CinA family protein [Pseudomonadota bacterium]